MFVLPPTRNDNLTIGFLLTEAFIRTFSNLHCCFLALTAAEEKYDTKLISGVTETNK